MKTVAQFACSLHVGSQGCPFGEDDAPPTSTPFLSTLALGGESLEDSFWQLALEHGMEGSPQPSTPRSRTASALSLPIARCSRRPIRTPSRCSLAFRRSAPPTPFPFARSATQPPIGRSRTSNAADHVATGRGTACARRGARVSRVSLRGSQAVHHDVKAAPLGWCGRSQRICESTTL